MQSGEQYKWVNNYFKELTHKNIVERTLQPTDNALINVNVTGALQFYCAKNADDAVGVVFVTVNVGEEVIRPIADFGDYVNNHFFNVYNPNDLNGSYEVELM